MAFGKIYNAVELWQSKNIYQQKTWSMVFSSEVSNIMIHTCEVGYATVAN